VEDVVSKQLIAQMIGAAEECLAGEIEKASTGWSQTAETGSVR
jgi:hypothetical protein